MIGDYDCRTDLDMNATQDDDDDIDILSPDNFGFGKNEKTGKSSAASHA